MFQICSGATGVTKTGPDARLAKARVSSYDSFIMLLCVAAFGLLRCLRTWWCCDFVALLSFVNIKSSWGIKQPYFVLHIWILLLRNERPWPFVCWLLVADLSITLRQVITEQFSNDDLTLWTLWLQDYAIARKLLVQWVAWNCRKFTVRMSCMDGRCRYVVMMCVAHNKPLEWSGSIVTYKLLATTVLLD